MTSKTLSTLVLSFLTATSVVPAAEAASVQLEPIERWTNFFADREVEVSFRVKSHQEFQGRAAWSVSINQATLVRRLTDVNAAPERPGKLALRFTAPPVREGIVLRAVLTIRILSADGKPQGEIERVFWIFPESPFTGRSRWLKALDITLFDPAHTLAPVLTKAGIPFEEATNLGNLTHLRKGMLVIGEGASFKEEPGLAALLLQLAARGVPVLCLAPSEGTIALPATAAADKDKPEGVALRRRSVIARLDKRLDSVAWPEDGKVVSSSLALSVEDGALTGEVVAGESGWPWLEIEYAGHGRFILCGFDIARHWEKGPAPRYLFAALLNRLAGEEPSSQREQQPGDRE